MQNGATNIIREQREWGRKIYAVTDKREWELKQLGYSNVRIASEVAKELRLMGYVPRKDVYTMFTMNVVREFRKMVQRKDLDMWVRFFLDL